MNYLLRSILLLLSISLFQACADKKDWDLIWSEEFDYTGSPATETWAYGGSWGGNEGVDKSALPVEYKIDYVRYYKTK